MKNKKVLVLGNSPHINKIKFERLDPNIITLGTNRIWLKMNPTYLFFHDIEIIKELQQNQERLEDLKKNTKIIASDWLRIMARRHSFKLPEWVTIYDRPDRYKFVDCVSTGIEIMDRYILKDDTIDFYIAGVELRWMNPSHFWKVDQKQKFLNSKGPEWYETRFNRTLKNFETLKAKGFNMVSSTPNSRLNKLMRYEAVGRFYV